MSDQQPLSSFRRMPESSGSNDFLDAGLRRHDGYKVNGTAVSQYNEFSYRLLYQNADLFQEI